MANARASELEAVRVYRTLLALYPAEFRGEYGRELCLLFADRLRETQSRGGLLMLWLQSIAGVVIEAPKEHWHMILHDLRYAFRAMRKDPMVTAAAITVLGLGIGAATLVFSLANGLLIRPLPYPHTDQLVAIDERSLADPADKNTLNFLNYRDLRARTKLLDEIGVYISGVLTVRGEGDAERIEAGSSTDGALRALGVAPLFGRLFTAADCLPNAPKVVLLNENLWRRRYGSDRGILGKSLNLDGSEFTVIGVMPAAFRFPTNAMVWTPFNMNPAEASRTDYFLRGIGRMKSGVTVEQAQSELQSLLEQIHRENPAANNERQANAVPYRQAVAGVYRNSVLTLLVVVGLLLLIACANVSNLLLVKASARVREFALRTALGASGRRLIRQLLVESLVLGLLGGVAGAILAYAGTPLLVALIPVQLPHWLEFPVDGRVLAFAVFLSLLTSFVFGLIPAIGASKGELVDRLKAGGRGVGVGIRHKLLRNGLVIAEVALSMMLLAGAGLMVRSFLSLRLQNLGYRSDNLLTMTLDYPDKRYPNGAPVRELADRLRQEIVSIPGVKSAAFSSSVPFDRGWGRYYTIEGHPMALKDMAMVNYVVVTPQYFGTLGIPLQRGRNFTDADSTAPRIVVVTESFAARHWPSKNAIGQRMRFGPPKSNEPWHTVVGIVADNKHRELRKSNQETVYLPYYDQLSLSSLAVRTTIPPGRISAAITSRIVGVDRDISVSQPLTLSQIVDRVAWQDRFLTVLFGVFAVIALSLAAVGLYGVMSYTVRLATHEIGVRMALGAPAGAVQFLVIRKGMSLAVTGLVIGTAAALGLTELLRTQLYGVSPEDPATYLTAITTLFIVALIACAGPSLRAVRVDPIIALRHE